MPAEPLLEGQTQDLVGKLVHVVLLVYKVVYLGLVVPAVQDAVGGAGNPVDPVLRKVLELALCLFHL